MNCTRLIDAEKLVRKLEELGFRFYEETKKSRCYKRGTDRVYITRRNHLPERMVRQILWQQRCQRDDIERFVAACNG